MKLNFLPLALLLLAAASTSLVAQRNVFQWQGHRGARGYRPENTLAAFEYALQAGSNWLEMDLAVTADSAVLVCHDPTLQPPVYQAPAGSGPGPHVVWRLSLAQAQAFTCGGQPHPRFARQEQGPQPIPTLVQVLTAFPPLGTPNLPPPASGPVSYNIEIKSQPNWDGHLTPAVGTFCQAVLAALAEVQAHWAQLYGPDSAAHLLAQCVWIQSFDPRALRVLRTQHGFRNLVFLSERPISPAGVQRRVGFLPPVVSPYHKWVGPRTVRRFHRAGMQVVPWTVNDARRVRQLVAYGVDGIITDYPPAGIE